MSSETTNNISNVPIIKLSSGDDDSNTIANDINFLQKKKQNKHNIVTGVPKLVAKPVIGIVSHAVRFPLNAEKGVVKLARSISNTKSSNSDNANDANDVDDGDDDDKNKKNVYNLDSKIEKFQNVSQDEKIAVGATNDTDSLKDVDKYRTDEDEEKLNKFNRLTTVEKALNIDKLLNDNVSSSEKRINIGDNKEIANNAEDSSLFKSSENDDEKDFLDLGASRVRATSRVLTTGARRFTSTGSKTIKNTMSTINPIKNGERVINSTGLVITKPKDNDSLTRPSAIQSISRSFAEYLTAASMYAGFQDIEDQDNEVESIRDNLRNHETSLSSVVSRAPENELDLTALDNDDASIHTSSDTDNDPYEDAKLDSGGIDGEESLDSRSTLGGPHSLNETIRSNYLGMKPKRALSKFELSVVDKLEGKLDVEERKNYLNKKAIAISKKLCKVFEIDPSEIFNSDYSCWLMGDVLLQGHIYITDRNVLFFAYLPKRNKNEIVKSGVLSIKSFHSLRMHRKWIILRDHTFSVYSSSTELYFPELVIDLRTALRAETYGISKDEDLLFPVWIKIITENRTHWFQAENHDSAKSWVTILKKHIFSSRNKGDQVAIKIPLKNIIDLELNSVVGMTKNLRIKVIENAESFAIDDYYLMFFANGQRAVDDINEVLKQADVQLSNSYHVDPKELKNSELFKSRIEELKKSSSVVKSTNLKPREKKKTFREIRDAILSSDDDGDDDGDDIYDDEELGDNGNNKKPLTSIGEILSSVPTGISDTVKSPTKHLIPLRFRGRSKSVNIESSGSLKSDSSSISTEDQDNENRWSTKSLVQGIQSLMFSGPPLHFDESLSDTKGDIDPFFVKSKKTREACQKRFVKRFSLNESTKLLATYQLYLMKGLPSYGKLYIGSNEVCFRSTIVGSNTLMILPILDIENVNKESGFRFGYYGLVLVIRGHEELFFEFSSSDARDDCESQIIKRLDLLKKSTFSDSNDMFEKDNEVTSDSKDLKCARLRMFEAKLNNETGVSVPIIVEDHPSQTVQFNACKSYRFALLTIGSRGDVQPYIALGKALLKEGHHVKIVTHAEFKEWIVSYGIDFGQIAGDPSELMALMVSNPSINYTFLKEAKAKFRNWIDDLLITSWEACQDCDVLIESPSSIGGIHIAEKLQIPYFRAFTMPWTRTRAYPHAFLVPDQKLGGAYNYMTHVAFENGYWRGTCYQVNKWRVETLKLHKTSLAAMHQNNVPFLYNMSPVVFPPSIDFPDWVRVTGYWFLDESQDYTPPKPLIDFIKKAREDGKKLVYIGFGSIVVEDPKQLTKDVVDAVLESGVRCILNKGWSDRLGAKDKNKVEIELPDEVFNSGNVPHDWLFTQIDAAVHHGGSGTTGASLRFGLPTIIKPFFGDQKFYASRVEDLGCGFGLKTLQSKALAKALKEVTTNQRIIDKAKAVGAQIRSENGVQKAIDSIYVLMDYAKNLSVSKHKHLDENVEPDDQEEPDEVEMDGSWLLV